jgi:PadR family transcriptional regulator PadR
MDIENTKTQMRKGILEYCILAIINQGEAYSSDVIEQLKAAKMIVVEGTVYPLLTRLKNAGVLQYKWEESTSGPPRKYYTLTQLGKDSLKELDDTWQQLNAAVSQITKS